MFQLHEANSFAQKKDGLNQTIAQLPKPEDLRDHLRSKRSLLATLYRASTEEVHGIEEHGTLENEFADAVIGDGLRESRVKIFAAVLKLTTDPTSEIWTCFVSALALANPGTRRDDFRDECIPDLDTEYIKSHLGQEFALEFEEELCAVSPPDSASKFEERKQDLYKLVDAARRGYETETWTIERNDAGEFKKQGRKYTDATGHFWPDQAASKVVEDNKELLRNFYLEHSKYSVEFIEATALGQRHKLRYARKESDAFLAGVQARARILAILIYDRVRPEAHAWNVFIGACMTRSKSLLDEKLPYTPDDIKRIFGTGLLRGERDSFHDRQFSFCPLKITRPSSDRSESRIPLELAHMPFERKEKCGEGASAVAVFYVDIYPGHLQDERGETWNQKVIRLAMKQIPFDKFANQEVKVNMLIHDQAFKHDHIVQIRGIHWLTNAVLIFMEPAQCNLYEYMTIDCTSSAATPDIRKTRLQMITKIADALAHLHGRLEDDSKVIHFMHKDLKAENILVMGDDDDPETKILKLTDFGLSSIKAESSSATDRGPQPVRTPADRSSRTRLPATAVHFAPEASEDNVVTKKSDVWAFGIGLAEVVAWIAKGSEGLEDLKQKRAAYKHPSWIPDENGKPMLSPGIVAWFDGLTADGSLGGDEKLMYTSCWLLLKHVCLVCDPERRGRMKDVRDFLRKICNGSTAVQAAILSDFPQGRLNDVPAHTDHRGDELVCLPTDSSGVTRQDSARDVPNPHTRKSTSSGSSHTTTHNSARTGTSPRPTVSETSRVAPADQERRTSRFKSLVSRFKSRSAGTGSPPPNDSTPLGSNRQRRKTTSVSHNDDTSQRQQGPLGNMTELHQAANSGDLNLILSLLEHIDPDTEQGLMKLNAEDDHCMTPLLYALRQDHVQAAILLLEKGADVNIISNHGRSALHYAVEIYPPDTDQCLTALLLERSPELIKAKDPNGDTALHQLADLAMVGTLDRLKKMVDVLKASEVGVSALDEALRTRSGPRNLVPRDMVQEGEDRSKIITLLTPGSGSFLGTTP
jgi:serine/threonine protein kinase